MRVAVLYSGGKDSNLAAYRAFRAGHDLAVLITVVPHRQDSWMFHRPNVEHTWVQADCMGIGLELLSVSGEKEVEVKEMEQQLVPLVERYDLEALCTGAIASRYQKERVEALCSSLGIAELSPLWGADEESLIWEMLGLGFEIYFTSVSAEGLGKEWLGSQLDEARLQSLLRLRERSCINISGEGGEYETFVVDMPLFRRRIRVIKASTRWARNAGTWDIQRLEVVEKVG